ncbi:MAG: hypothetical protein K2O17_06855 [Bacteroidaceae bacterium]|nr:hypothetical protein [Bacteroidaceae bacterium]
MKKNFRYLLLLLVAACSLSLVSCDGDDDSLSPDDRVRCATVSIAEKDGYISLNDDVILMFLDRNGWSRTIFFGSSGANRLAYIPEAESLDMIRTVPATGWSESCYLSGHYVDGGYLGEYTTPQGKPVYIRMWITFARTADGGLLSVTVSWQRFAP